MRNPILAFIRLEDIHKNYDRGKVDVPVLKGVTSRSSAARWSR